MIDQRHFAFVRTESPASVSKRDWQAVSDALHAAGVPEYQRALNAAKGAGLVPDDVRTILTEFLANAQRFSGPEAVLYRLANGRWPSMTERHSVAAPARSPGGVHEFEMRRARLFKELKRAGKTQDEIDAEIERRLGPSPPAVGTSRGLVSRETEAVQSDNG